MSNSVQGELSFGEFLLALVRYWYIWVITALVVTAGAFVWGKRTVVPVYTADSTLMIYHANSSPDQWRSDITAMSSYRDLVTSNAIVQPVQTRLEKVTGYQADQTTLAAGISTWVSPNTVNLKIRAQGSSPKLAAQTTNLLARSIRQHLPQLVPDSGTIRIIEPAKAKRAALLNGQQVAKLTLGGFVFGLYLGIIATFVYTVWRNN
ncbi:YveK family protein [Loigolactobacillus binensis]|uniref:YveK family protein n=1 Tax=Loigolactobacillus binensis TaxID=2559922 RepID=A0ABW3EE41_9LACO|nr:exopolysaccharide biosynthesis protein [Loigolactobacillus binensis]